jgi:hypothetical protein
VSPGPRSVCEQAENPQRTRVSALGRGAQGRSGTGREERLEAPVLSAGSRCPIEQEEWLPRGHRF